jgi:hypothetical protein
MPKSLLTHLAVLLVGLSLGSASLALAGGTTTTATSVGQFKCRENGPAYSTSLADHVACLERAVFTRQRQFGFGKHLLGTLIDGRNTLAALCEQLYLADLSGSSPFGLEAAFWNVRQIDCPNLIARGP